MVNDLILLTGATGFVGSRALVTLLESGFRVRCAVRSESGRDKIMASPSLRSIQPSEEQLAWVIVHDITVPNAYDEAVKGVKYIIHCASPVVKLRPDGRQGTDDEIYVNPAVQGVVGMLESAAAHAGDTVERIVVTSSIVAIMPRSCFRGEGLDRPAFTGESRLPWPVAPYEDAYSASKTAALEASERWMREHKPAFDLISIMPAWIFGREELATTPEALLSGSNGVLLELLRGNKFDWTINTGYVSVQDVVDAHIRALSPSVPGGKSFILSKHIAFEEARDFAKKHFPEAFANGVFREDSKQLVVSIPTDESEGEELLGRQYENCEDVVKEVAAQYVKLVDECK
ncbi:3-beta hydroxysteroid dehydrogenase [Colletotrichum karsti]|uniref:3-beta hydroxysteroid dehydrogenase n=1 Tax=Colletotrichum karsti TaxID=1095194 RepID=A0A9P6HWQ9_9PEZI|nr:3-beta hydroxysteroid dehydrogenase [Colletotrichum karsti]KAF9872253.1 3-beta hydroxysteroid dehydrogenase [Colletotrichum karsti]